MFKFGFVSEPSSTDDGFSTENTRSIDLHWLPSKEIVIDEAINIKDIKVNSIGILKLASEELLYVKPSTILQAITNEKTQLDENICHAEQNHSDLIPSKYEGGLKLWECTHDIANFLDPSQVHGKSVLDLGCGIGLLGILTLKLQADKVYFQDYNAEVLKHATIPNVCLNTEPQQASACRFFSGDWGSFADSVQPPCDLVLSSETIYNPDNHLKLHDAIQRILKPTGFALVGAKSYYFGVGGSTRQFEKLVQTRNVFNVEVVWKCSEGVQREIMKLTFKNTGS